MTRRVRLLTRLGNAVYGFRIRTLSATIDDRTGHIRLKGKGF